MRPAILALLAAVVAAICAGGTHPAVRTETRGVPHFRHVILIVFENHEASDVLGNSDVPTFNRLASTYATISRYNAVLAVVPALGGSLGPLLQQHREHLARLRARLIEPDTASAPEHSPAVAASAAGAPAPGTPDAARAYLRHAEQAAAQALLGQLAAAPPSLAQLLASIAASEATHALLLGPGRRAA